MSDENEIPDEVKKLIIDRHIQIQRNTIFEARILHKVNKSLGNEDALKELEKSMVNAEKMILALQKEREAIGATVGD